LAVLSSDALSSVAYASEEVLRVLMVGGLAAMSYSRPIALLIATLMAVVAFSYRQTIKVYNKGRRRLHGGQGEPEHRAGLTGRSSAADRLHADGRSLGVGGRRRALLAFPGLHINRVELGLILVALLMLGNLRGIRESARIFALPTYGLHHRDDAPRGQWHLPRTGWRRNSAVDVVPLPTFGAGSITTFMLLTAFANGCTAMTVSKRSSTERPRSNHLNRKNAGATLIMMAVLAITMFIGVTHLASSVGAIPSATETIVVADWPGGLRRRHVPVLRSPDGDDLHPRPGCQHGVRRLSAPGSVVARDGYMPRQFMNQGDKLAFSNGSSR
jgi:amino acid transporter